MTMLQQQRRVAPNTDTKVEVVVGKEEEEEEDKVQSVHMLRTSASMLELSELEEIRELSDALEVMSEFNKEEMQRLYRLDEGHSCDAISQAMLMGRGDGTSSTINTLSPFKGRTGTGTSTGGGFFLHKYNNDKSNEASEAEDGDVGLFLDDDNDYDNVNVVVAPPAPPPPTSTLTLTSSPKPLSKSMRRTPSMLTITEHHSENLWDKYKHNTNWKHGDDYDNEEEKKMEPVPVPASQSVSTVAHTLHTTKHTIAPLPVSVPSASAYEKEQEAMFLAASSSRGSGDLLDSTRGKYSRDIASSAEMEFNRTSCITSDANNNNNNNGESKQGGGGMKKSRSMLNFIFSGSSNSNSKVSTSSSGSSSKNNASFGIGMKKSVSMADFGRRKGGNVSDLKKSSVNFGAASSSSKIPSIPTFAYPDGCLPPAPKRSSMKKSSVCARTTPSMDGAAIADDATASTTTSDSTANSVEIPPKPPTMKRNISFTNIEIREYGMTLGDNPSVSYGPPVQLSWEYKTNEAICIEQYETSREPRRKKYQMVLSYYVRRKMLGEAKIDKEEIKKAIASAKVIKTQRSRTRALLCIPIAQPLEAAMESLVRKIKK